jgi:hypothetical protein
MVALIKGVVIILLNTCHDNIHLIIMGDAYLGKHVARDDVKNFLIGAGDH